VQPGDIVDVLLERTEDKDGYVVSRARRPRR
jgi:ribosomal protein S1